MKVRQSHWACCGAGLLAVLTLASCGLLDRSGAASPIRQTSKNRVTVERIERLDQRPFGPLAQATHGDYLMQADGLRLAFSAPENNARQKTLSGGFLVDVSSDIAILDNFGGIAPHYSAAEESTLRITEVAIRKTRTPLGMQPVLITFGEDVEHKGLKIETQYLLDPRTRLLRMTTTLKNESREPVKDLQLGDLIYWGGLSCFVEQIGYLSRTEELKATTPWLVGVIDNQTIGLFAEEEGRAEIDIWHRNGRTQTIQRRLAELSPGQTVTYSRQLRFGDQNAVLTSNEYYQRHPAGSAMLNGLIIDAQTGNPIPRAIVHFEHTLNEREQAPVPKTMARTDQFGQFSARLPAGMYFLYIDAAGRPAPFPTPVFEVRVNDPPTLRTFALGPISTLQYTVTEKGTDRPLPCKLVLTPLGNTPPHDLGPIENLPSAKNTHFSFNGRGSIPVRPGDYQLTILRGIEYKPASMQLSIDKGEREIVEVQLERYLDTTGFVSVDLGTRTDASYDCMMQPSQRVATAMAEGVEYLITGDINTVTDLQPTIEEYRAGEFIKASPGLRLMPVGRNAYGEYLIFPLTEEVASPSALAHRLWKFGDNTTKVFGLLRQTFPDSLIALGDPIDPVNGYFTHFGWLPEMPAPPSAQQISYDFDLLEAFAGKGFSSANMNYQLYFQMVANKIVRQYYGYSRSRLPILEEIGYPRLYVKSSTDEPAKIDPREIADNIKAGRLLVTNGPFIRVTIDGKGLGELLTPTNPEKRFRFRIEVESPDFAEITDIMIQDNGTFHKGWMDRPPIASHKKFPVRSDPVEFDWAIKEDMVITVIAIGQKPIYPAATPGFDDEQELIPFRAFAVTGPIFIDADGDGQCVPIAMRRTTRDR